MNIAIIDDMIAQVEKIKELIQEFDTENLSFSIHTYSSAEELLKEYGTEKSFDFIFLDIEMGGMSGIDAAAKIREKDSNVIIIFISAHSHYVTGAFKAKAFQYLIKPVKKEDFDKIFKEALNYYQNLHYKYAIDFKNRKNITEINNILYIESYRRILTVHTIDQKEFSTYANLNKETKKLIPYGFIRTHQGYLVNAKYIESIDIDSVHLSKGIKVPMSEHRKKEVLRYYNMYLSGCSI